MVIFYSLANIAPRRAQHSPHNFLSICLPVCLSICLSAYLPVSQCEFLSSSVFRCDCLSVCLPGAIPESIGLLTNLVKLNLSDNKLSGELPCRAYIFELKIHFLYTFHSIPNSNINQIICRNYCSTTSAFCHSLDCAIDVFQERSLQVWADSPTSLGFGLIATNSLVIVIDDSCSSLTHSCLHACLCTSSRSADRRLRAPRVPENAMVP